MFRLQVIGTLALPVFVHRTVPRAAQRNEAPEPSPQRLRRALEKTADVVRNPGQRKFLRGKTWTCPTICVRFGGKGN